MTVIQEFIESLGKVAVLGRQVAKLEEEVTGKEVEALTRILEKVMPVMPAIDCRIEKAAYHSGHQMHSWEYGYLEERGIVLVDNFSKKYTDKDYRGDYEGERLVLTRSGKLLEVTRCGEWSNWQNECSNWGSEQTELTIEDAVKSHGFKAIIQGLTTAFKDAVEKNEKKEVDLTGRLAVLEEMSGLML